MRPYIKGEDLIGISVSPEDNPKEDMGMIARNPENYNDQWYVARDYFEKNFELLEEYHNKNLEATEENINEIHKIYTEVKYEIELKHLESNADTLKTINMDKFKGWLKNKANELGSGEHHEYYSATDIGCTFRIKTI